MLRAWSVGRSQIYRSIATWGEPSQLAARRDSVFMQDPRGEVFTYGDLYHRSSVIAEHIISTNKDILPLRGQSISFLYPPGFEFAATLVGIWRAGAIAVPLCTSHPPAELEYLIRDSKSVQIFADHSFRSVTEKLPFEVDSLPSETTMFPTGLELPPVADEDPGLIIYTSGTTGHPKGVVSTHRALLANVTDMVDAWQWSSSDRLLHCLPLHHVHGLINGLLTPMYAGASIEFLAKFDPAEVLHRLHNARDITVFFGVPAMFWRLLRHYKPSPSNVYPDWRHLRLVVSGSAALLPSMFEEIVQTWGVRVLERYGMTETGMLLTNPYRPEDSRLPGSVGYPFSSVQTKLQALDGQQVEVNRSEAVGILCVKGPMLFSQYFGRPKETAEAFDAEGFFITGDVVSQSQEDGRIRILGRASADILKTGGYKVSALEIEQVLSEHPQVKEVAVIGQPSEQWGDAIVAVLAVERGTESEKDKENQKVGWGDFESEALRQALREHCKTHLAPYKVPKEFILLQAELPRNVMGKINKKQLLSAIVNIPQL
jgi:malonyl-CoA/methylmalonyl-CoA synthetase